MTVDYWKWPTRKKRGDTRCKVKLRKGKFDIWKWPNRKKKRASCYVAVKFIEVISEHRKVSNGDKLSNKGSGKDVCAKKRLFGSAVVVKGMSGSAVVGIGGVVILVVVVELVGSAVAMVDKRVFWAVVCGVVVGVG